ncbi:hypothetical protein [Nocardioides sp. Soil805]|uniref:hypothetical protein n=1 Tax=Nocardioides sp. Soil805 TaxID=1736416 RepID=UPI0007027839|nr:hypothetical protein [Nocardioides sp. Soil805]KRF36829.1 hypothetical protein ASG94_05335 [Nocardioides sp. Soil805]
MSQQGGLPWSWGDLSGTTDHFGGRGPGLHAARGVRVAAPPDVVWRWVRQLQVAPYSYDLVDNLGRRSPRSLTPGLGEFEPGGRFIIFTVRAVDPGRSVELEITRAGAVRLFGPVLMAYSVTSPDADGGSGGGAGTVLRCDLFVPGAARGVATAALMWGDLVMMRKQLLTWKALAERDVR